MIAIIGTLGTIIFTSLLGVRTKARDQRRLKDLDTIQGAVEQYYRDVGHYPITNCSTNGGNSYAGFQGAYSTKIICPTSGGSGTNSLAAELAPYIPGSFVDPNGPIPQSSDAGYLYNSSDGANYCILIWRTPENMNNFSTKQIDMGRCGSITSSGACSNTSNNNIYYSSTPGATGC